MKRILFLLISILFLFSCDDSQESRDLIIINEPVFVQHFRNGQYPDSSYDGCQDTYMRSDTPSTTYGSASNMYVSSDTSFIRRTLIRFDILGALPSDITIKKAVITFFKGSSTSGANDPDPYSFNIEAWVYINIASYGTPSWDDYTWDEISSFKSRATFDVYSYQAIEVPVETILTWQKDNQSNFGLILKIADESIHEGVELGSSDNANINMRPMLSIYYSYK